MKTRTIGVFVGSARRGSYSRSIARALASFMPEAYTLRFIEMAHLPLFNQDLEDDGKTPPEWEEFRREVTSLDGFLFVTPEHNRGIPALLKNGIDIASRPYGSNLWAAKPGAIVSVSPSRLGGYGANHALRQCMVFLDVYMMQQMEAYVANVADMLDAEGNIPDERYQKLMQDLAASIASWMDWFIR